MIGRLPSVNAKRVIRALERAGFVVDRVSGSHYLMVDPRDPRRGVSRDLKPGTLRSILRQAGLSIEELAELL
jgi:predicted RNA binding protein YcfA (HicA-like mRNA interferase family)